MRKFCLKIFFGLFLTIFISAFWSKNIVFASEPFCKCYDANYPGSDPNCTLKSRCLTEGGGGMTYCSGEFNDNQCKIPYTPPTPPTHYALLYNPTTKDGECQAVVGRDCSGYAKKTGYELKGCYTKEDECQKALNILKDPKTEWWCKCTTSGGPSGDKVTCKKADADNKCGSCAGPMTKEQACVSSDLPTPKPVDPIDTSLEFKDLKLEDLSKINPLKDSETFGDEGSRTLGNIVSVLLTMIIFPLAGLILFLMIVWGGYQILNGSLTGNQSKIDLGKNKITYAIYGFLLLFASWWLWSMVEIAIGINKN